ncbi:MAG: hypothetical protein AYP45_16475 [Candidatus Brocadia carolinensis]|uniref:Uncharacterized protein n=1 Tax=Candidatus Brocadia carolinensis TaxID=1004156 RepID=A0A1V4APT6_9BACT|nr:MAG: hypothetical protein AYP45_16475 [Candidatus Brocadia caroliniensis]
MFFFLKIPSNPLEILPFLTSSCNKASSRLQDLGFILLKNSGYLKKYLRLPAGHDFRYVALKVNGYSMEPILEEGDIVVIDRLIVI